MSKIILINSIFFIAFMAGSDANECVYDTAGLCMYDCPPGTYSYNTACGPLTPEPTCDNPNPVPEDGDICDYSDCYCKHPTVRDTVSKKCVKLEDCPKKEQTKGHCKNSV